MAEVVKTLVRVRVPEGMRLNPVETVGARVVGGPAPQTSPPSTRDVYGSVGEARWAEDGRLECVVRWLRAGEWAARDPLAWEARLVESKPVRVAIVPVVRLEFVRRNAIVGRGMARGIAAGDPYAADEVAVQCAGCTKAVWIDARDAVEGTVAVCARCDEAEPEPERPSPMNWSADDCPF